MFHRRRTRFKFTEKKHSKKGMITLIVAIGILLWFCIFVQRSLATVGGLSTYYGSAGVLAMVGSLIALVLSVQSMLEEDSFQLFPRTAFVICLLDCICWFGTYALGFGIIG